MARRLLILLHGDLGGLWPDWAGCRFDGPELWTPEDTNYTLGEIRAIPYREALIQEYRMQIRKMVRQRAALREI
ncbi:MAG: hypothetical protein GY906_36165, partial [bacterium]|nr:hypothetical protein [bacterium]